MKKTGNMDFKSCIRDLENLKRGRGLKKLERMEKLCATLGDPQNKFAAIHVTGTNGKGSVCAMSESMLRATGLKTGLFTSPHLFSYTERIQIQGRPISEDAFIQVFKKVSEAIEPIVSQNPAYAPGLFEFTTLMAYLHFHEEKVDAAVVEVGIGGAQDATNVLPGRVAVITNVDKDHMEVLGNSKESIAREKSGIIKKNSTLITTEKDPLLLEILRAKSEEMQAESQVLNLNEIRLLEESWDGQSFDFGQWKNLQIQLLGAFQRANAIAAIHAVRAFLGEKKFDEQEADWRRGLEIARWGLRCEVMMRNPTLIIDGGHNPHGILHVVQELSNWKQVNRRILVMAAAHTKPAKDMAELLAPHVDVAICSEGEYKAAPAELLYQAFLDMGREAILLPRIREALEEAFRQAKKDDLIIVVGSLYFASYAAKTLKTF